MGLREYDKSRSPCRYDKVAEEIVCGILFQSKPRRLDYRLSIEPVCPISAAKYSGINTTKLDARAFNGSEIRKTAAIVAPDHGMISSVLINPKLAEIDSPRLAAILLRLKDNSMPMASRHAWTEPLQETKSAGLTVEVGCHANL